MVREGIPMDKVLEVLKERYGEKVASVRKIAKTLGISRPDVQKYLDLSASLGIRHWPLNEAEGEKARLRAALYPEKEQESRTGCVIPDWKEVEKELTARKKSGVTLLSGQWIASHPNILITGPTGVGKRYIAEALGHKACRLGYNVLLVRFPRLFQSTEIARSTGKLHSFLKTLARQDVLILEDFALTPMTSEHRQDLFEILEDRHNLRSTILTSQIRRPEWHDRIGDPTLADAILDRLVHGAYTLELKGESMRKTRAKALRPDSRQEPSQDQ